MSNKYYKTTYFIRTTIEIIKHDQPRDTSTNFGGVSTVEDASSVYFKREFSNIKDVKMQVTRLKRLVGD